MTDLGPVGTTQNICLFAKKKLCQQEAIRELKLGNDNGDGNENTKKQLVSISKTTTLLVHHAFLYLSYPLLLDHNVKFHVLSRTGTQENNFLFLFLNFDIQLQKYLPVYI